MCADNTRKRKKDLGPIPKEWRRKVIEILDRNERGTIQITQKSKRHWSSLFPHSFVSERNEALIKTLRIDNMIGRRIFGIQPEGETYAFFFYFENTKLYGKINLLKGEKIIFILSTHKPEKGNIL